MTEDPMKRWSEISFAEMLPCTCSDFDKHYFYSCPDDYCPEIHDTCEDKPPVHKSIFIATEVEATSDDAL